MSLLETFRAGLWPFWFDQISQSFYFCLSVSFISVWIQQLREQISLRFMVVMFVNTALKFRRLFRFNQLTSCRGEVSSRINEQKELWLRQEIWTIKHSSLFYIRFVLSHGNNKTLASFLKCVSKGFNWWWLKCISAAVGWKWPAKDDLMLLTNFKPSIFCSYLLDASTNFVSDQSINFEMFKQTSANQHHVGCLLNNQELKLQDWDQFIHPQ